MTILEGSRLLEQHQESYENWKGWAEQYLKRIDPREMDAHQIGKWLEAYQFDLQIPID
jgi:hypothetical protein